MSERRTRVRLVAALLATLLVLLVARWLMHSSSQDGVRLAAHRGGDHIEIDAPRRDPRSREQAVVRTEKPSGSIPSGAATAAITPADGTSLTGRVVDRFLVPVAGVRVGLTQIDGENRASNRTVIERSGQTDESGRFSFRSVNAGRKIVHAARTGAGLIDGTSITADATAGARTDVGDIVLDPARNGAVKLQVLDATHKKPVIGAEVNLCPYDVAHYQNETAITDAEGSVTFRCWPAGTDLRFFVRADRHPTSAGRILPSSQRDLFLTQFDKSGRFLIGPAPERIIFAAKEAIEEVILLGEMPVEELTPTFEIKLGAVPEAIGDGQVLRLFIANVKGERQTIFNDVLSLPQAFRAVAGEYLLEVVLLEKNIPSPSVDSLFGTSLVRAWTTTLNLHADQEVVPQLERPWIITGHLRSSSGTNVVGRISRTRGTVLATWDSVSSGTDGNFRLRVPPQEPHVEIWISAKRHEVKNIQLNLNRSVRNEAGDYVLDVGDITLSNAD